MRYIFGIHHVYKIYSIYSIYYLFTMHRSSASYMNVCVHSEGL